MDVATLLAQHVHALHAAGHLGGEESDRDLAERLAQIARDLDHLVRGVRAQIVSCLALSVVLTVPAGTVTISRQAAGSDAADAPRRPVLASLAVPLPGFGVVALLVLQAADAGAFLLVADDLTGRLDPGEVLSVDQHLDLWVDPAGDALSGGLADLRAVDQAAGVLMDRGWPPPDAYRRLRELADASHGDVPALARQLLEGLHEPPAAGRV